jgi:AcrR family transcriptional regulator
VKTRTVTAAIHLFAEHGVGGTSLQMIADHLGVTKAAVYHQFKAKDEIVVAVGEAELARLEATVANAEAEPQPERRREVLIVGIVDLAIDRRKIGDRLLGDPVLYRFFADNQPYRQVMRRLAGLLMDGAGPEKRVSTAMLLAAIGGAVTHPLVRGLDDGLIRAELLRMARSFLELPG